MNGSTDEILQEMLRWIRASSFKDVQRLLEEEFKKGGEVDAKRANVYQLSDGTTTSVAIAKAVGVSQPLISTLWKRWRQIGLAETAGEGGRQTRRCFSLEDFGLAPIKAKEAEGQDG